MIIVIYLAYNPRWLVQRALSRWPTPDTDLLTGYEKNAFTFHSETPHYSGQCSLYVPENKLLGDFDTIILDVPGGAFVKSSPSPSIYEHLSVKIPILSVTYPTLFKYKLEDMVMYLDILLTATESTFDKKIIIIAQSAGAYIAALTLKKGHQKVEAFITLCGYFGPSTITNPLINALTKTYLTGWSDKPQNNVSALRSGLRVYIYTGTNDFLISSSLKFGELCSPISLKQFQGSHLFFYDPIQGSELYDDISTVVASITASGVVTTTPSAVSSKTPRYQIVE